MSNCLEPNALERGPFVVLPLSEDESSLHQSGLNEVSVKQNDINTRPIPAHLHHHSASAHYVTKPDDRCYR
ncbi:unnamed protein product [Protopolystoma xenopodis]|uniref:Uncharacterized protein n=1 Tax=Protopolystoma xenopodis TaxID=117903 RepID=A0A448X1A5_9PLAT|nr:unnamed protein product [Protopolystoma xenopodis]